MARAVKLQYESGNGAVSVGNVPSERGEVRPFGVPTDTAAGASYRRAPADGSGAPAAVLAWRVILLAEIANFAGLRRHLGRLRADRLVLDIIDRATHHVPSIRSLAAGRTIAEFELGASDFVAI